MDGPHSIPPPPEPRIDPLRLLPSLRARRGSLLYRRQRRNRVNELSTTSNIAPSPAPPASCIMAPQGDRFEHARTSQQPGANGAFKREAEEELPRGRHLESASSDFETDGWSPERHPFQLPLHLETMPNSATSGMSFMGYYPKGEVTVSFPNQDGFVERIRDVNRGLVESASVLLASALDGNRLHLEALSSTTARPFMQFVYTGEYTLPTPPGEPFEDVPTSLLIHCQMYHLADIYDMVDLRRQANMHILRQCEFACSSPQPPVDLFPAIAYAYNHLSAHANVLETITAYCVSCFLCHRLGQSFGFRKLAYDLRPFHQGLCKVGMERRFEDEETAQAIIQLPFRPYAPASYASREDSRATQVFDDVYHFHTYDAWDGVARQPPKQSRALSATEASQQAKVDAEDRTADHMVKAEAIGTTPPTESSDSGMLDMVLSLRPKLPTQGAPKPIASAPRDSLRKARQDRQVARDKSPAHIASDLQSWAPAASGTTAHCIPENPDDAAQAMQNALDTGCTALDGTEERGSTPEVWRLEGALIAPREKAEHDEAVPSVKIEAEDTEMGEAEAVDVQDGVGYTVVSRLAEESAMSIASDDDDFVKVEPIRLSPAIETDHSIVGGASLNVRHPEGVFDAVSADDSDWDLL